MKGNLLSVADPFPPTPAPKPIIRKNIITQAVKLKEYLEMDPSRTFTETGNHFGVSRARVSQLMSIIEKLPEDFIIRAKHHQDPKLLSLMSGRKILQIAKTKNLQSRLDKLNRLKEDIQKFTIESD